MDRIEIDKLMDISSKQKEIDLYLSKRRMLGLSVEKFAICVDIQSSKFGEVSLVKLADEKLEKYKVPDFVTTIGCHENLKYMMDNKLVLVRNRHNRINGIFTVNKYIKEITLGINTHTISSNAFMGSSIERVIINGEIKEVCGSAFYDCKKLKEFDFGKLKNASIAECAFFGCKSIIRADLAGVINIGYRAFYNCKNLCNIKLGESLNEIKTATFFSCNIEKLYIPDSVKTIHSKAIEFNPIKYLKLGYNLEMIIDDFITKSSLYTDDKITIEVNCDLSKFSDFRLNIFEDENIKVICNEENAKILKSYTCEVEVK